MVHNRIYMDRVSGNDLDRTRPIVKKSFEIYKDQVDSITKIVTKNQIAGKKPNTLTGVVRAALDEYIKNFD